MKRKMIAATVAASILMALTACRISPPQEKTKIEAGIAIYDEQDVFVQGVIHEVFQTVQENTGEYDDLVLEMNDSGGNQLTQNAQVERFVDLQYQVICVNLVDRTNAAEIINEVKESDIPVIFFNREPAKADMELYDKAYYVGSDAEESARLQAGIVLDAWEKDPESIDTNGDGVVSYVILEGQRGHQDTAIRTEYSVKALEEGGMKLKKVEGGSAGFERGQAADLMERWLNQEGFEVELVLSNNDEMALGALEAIEKCGAKGITVVGIDGTEEGKAAVQEGRMLGTVVSDAKLYAETLLKMIRAVGNGEDVEKSVKYAEGKYVRIPWDIYTG